MKKYGKWFYVGGFVVAGLAGLAGFQAQWLSLLLLLVAILAGVFFADGDDLVHNGIRFLVFSAVYAAFDSIPAVGSYLTGMFGGMAMFWGAVLLTALVVHFVKKYFMSK